MSYAATHQRAARLVAKKGAPITWSVTTAGTYDATTDSYTTPVTTSCIGHAVEVDGDPQEYRDLELIALNPVTLLFTPTTFGQTPTLGMTGTWGSTVRTVKRIRTISPDANAIGCYVVAV